MKNWIVAAIAIGMGAAVSGALLVLSNPSRSEVQAFALARSVAAGDVIAPDALRLEPVMAGASSTSLFGSGDAPQLDGARAAHDLLAGQLLQRSDVADARTLLDTRLVFVPVKDAPPAVAGQTVDLFMIGGTGDSPSVIPFALGVQVRAVVTGGLVVAVPSTQATAFVYAGEVMRLVAVVGDAGAPIGTEEPISAPEQALAAVSHQ
jgi:hypothetical protein